MDRTVSFFVRFIVKSPSHPRSKLQAITIFLGR
jgi:hypothetical protein